MKKMLIITTLLSITSLYSSQELSPNELTNRYAKIEERRKQRYPQAKNNNNNNNTDKPSQNDLLAIRVNLFGNNN
jgi:hypothetical protein